MNLIKIKTGCKSYYLLDEPSCFYIHGDLDNIDVILFFRQIFKEHPEFKEELVYTTRLDG